MNVFKFFFQSAICSALYEMCRRNIIVGLEAVEYHDDCLKAMKTLMREIGIQQNSQVHFVNI